MTQDVVSPHTVEAHGAVIPALGFGAYGMGRAELLPVLPEALRAGFRHIDTAQITATKRTSASASPSPACGAQSSSSPPSSG